LTLDRTEHLKPDKKQLKKDYQQTPRAIGVFLIRNNLNDKVFLASGSARSDQPSQVSTDERKPPKQTTAGGLE